MKVATKRFVFSQQTTEEASSLGYRLLTSDCCLCVVQGVGMFPVEHLHLKHVLQTVSVLEAVVLRSFGPEGGQVLLTRDTGQVMLSRSGTRILTALRLEHPIAKMVVDCVRKHSTVTGDGSKTFILLLASFLRKIHIKACKESDVSHTYKSMEFFEAATARHLAEELLTFALEELGNIITTAVVPYGCCVSWKDSTSQTQSAADTSNPCVQKLLASFFHTRLGQTHSDFISNLTCELLSHWKFKHDLPSLSLQFISDNFPALHTPVSGFPISCSRVIEGQVIHRDFATLCPQADCQPVKAVVFTEFLQPKLLSAGDVLVVGCGSQVMEENTRKGKSIVEFSAFSEQSLEYVIANLQRLGVSVLLSAVKQSVAVLALAAQTEICVVECISVDELSLFAQLSGTTPVSDCWMIEPVNIATLTFCRPILLGANRYVHVAFHDLEERVTVNPYSLVICGAGEGQTDQYADTIQDAIHMLLTTFEPMGMTGTATSKKTLQLLEDHSDETDSITSNTSSPQQSVLDPGCVIPAGGIFEFLLNHTLLQHDHSSSVSSHKNVNNYAVSQLLANALLSVPQYIYSHSPRYFLQMKARFLCIIQSHSHTSSLHYEQGHTSLTQGCSTKEFPEEVDKIISYCYKKSDGLSKLFTFDSGLESVSCKYQLVLAVLQCVRSLLRVDKVLFTHTSLHTQSHRLKNISWEDTEDEAKD